MQASRRAFIKKALYTVLALFGLGFVLPTATLFTPVIRKKALTFFPLIAEDELPRAGVKKTELAYTVQGRERKTRVYIVSAADGAEPAIFSATCSHLGCLVNYSKEKRLFICPCHGGRYNLAGKNIAGPPPAPLARFPVETRSGMIFVGIRV